MRVPSLVLAAMALAPNASAQRPERLALRVGGGFSPSFSASGRQVSLQGPEIALVVPAGSLAGQRVLIEPSYFGGGRLSHGRDVDSDVVRLSAFVRHELRGVAARVGIGYAISGRARGGEFGRTSGPVVDLGVELPFGSGGTSGRGAYGDLHAVFSGDNRRSGVFAGVGLRL